mmetsp:Transcript_33940/g.45869  ORF Transcript_33940/g.45869 Transcript_33940/m.45869 type:complete len:205 (+) Transcript_33940:303-917(+)
MKRTITKHQMVVQGASMTILGHHLLLPPKTTTLAWCLAMRTILKIGIAKVISKPWRMKMMVSMEVKHPIQRLDLRALRTGIQPIDLVRALRTRKAHVERVTRRRSPRPNRLTLSTPHPPCSLLYSLLRRMSRFRVPSQLQPPTLLSPTAHHLHPHPPPAHRVWKERRAQGERGIGSQRMDRARDNSSRLLTHRAEFMLTNLCLR